MEIQPGRVVTLEFDLCRADGEIVETSDLTGPVTFLHGKGAIIPGLDARLVGMKAAEEATWEFPPEEAFGRADDAPTKDIPREEFPADAKIDIGLEFEAGIPGGKGSVVLRVESVDEKVVRTRMLHPLTDQSVSMSVRVVSVREATSAEAAAGRVLSTPPPPPKKPS